MNMLTSCLQSTKIEPITIALTTTHIACICSLAFDHVISSTDSWIIDSSASCHICYSRSLLHNWRKIEKTSVVLPTSFSVSVDSIGDVRILDDITLKDVLFVPTFQYNLISVSFLLKDNDIELKVF